MPGDWFEKQFTNYPKKYAIMKDRWKTAPFIVECSTDDLPKVERWHLAAISDFSWGKPKSERYVRIGKRLGYRFQLDRLACPSMWRRGEKVDVTSRWSNVGITPLYERFDVRYELLPIVGGAVWSTRSKLDLTKFLPGSSSILDRIAVPATLPRGKYRLRLAILDPTGIRAPLALASVGRDKQGRYPLGTVELK
jgi:hypothetical protein